MCSQSMTFRVKAKNGTHIIKELKAQSTLNDLLTSLSKLTSIEPEAVKILCGFPPKPLAQSDTSLSLQDLNMRTGDTLIVEEDSSFKQRRTDSWMRELQTSEGILTREMVPANNSCLFTSINYVMHGRLDLECATSMRELIAKVVSSDLETYSEAFLGKGNSEYCAWILSDQTWGGAIEVSILSQHFFVEIDVVDTQSVRVDRFGEDKNYNQRVLLIYDGIHYDPLRLESVQPGVSPITKFSTQDSAILAQAVELAAEAKSSRQFTDVRGFSLRCLICNTALKGNTEAQNHASATGHINFGEV